ncbi:PREDICTED: LAG1 longevity assurance homolog 2-like [Tarenaya hassleriana]|uniref:LAG1 longevity assurance homolog 2-like n=1 Tax=Tarenaya hassleriana TaxID=28532 RepID=UPI00053C65AB|nr:PREDICTED: LAG1 longevity assurance homolog 2-like [Tarenaya hassleriana]
MEPLSVRIGGAGAGAGKLDAPLEFRHFSVAVYFAFGFFFSRLILDRFVFHRIAVWLLSIGSASHKTNDATRAKIVKCMESLWKFAYYASCEIFVLKVIYREPWFSDTRQYFNGWPNQELKLSLKIYYMCQCGFYLYSVAALLTWETRRKDFAVMMSHHIITILLIGYSFLTRFFRVGSIILALHDASDVFMESAKIFKYSENELGASVCFGLFALSWLLLRLIYFPFRVIRATSTELGSYVDITTPEGMSMYYGFNTMLLMLLVFHIYWWYLIYSMIMRQLQNKGKVGEDIRSDSEDDD